MQFLIPPVPGLIPLHSFSTSGLHSFPFTPTPSTRASQFSDRLAN